MQCGRRQDAGGIAKRTAPPHLLRHACATHMLDKRRRRAVTSRRCSATPRWRRPSATPMSPSASFSRSTPRPIPAQGCPSRTPLPPEMEADPAARMSALATPLPLAQDDGQPEETSG